MNNQRSRLGYRRKTLRHSSS